MATSDILQTMADSITAAYDSASSKKAALPEHKNLQNLSAAIDSIDLGVDISDTTATASTVLSGDVFYTASGKRSVGIIPTYSGDFHEVGTWIGVVRNLGNANPSTVTFTKSADFPTTWETVTQDSVEFVKIPKMYRKINSVVDNQITGYSISNVKQDANYQIYPCFLDESGNELDYILIAKNITYADVTIGNARTQARDKGAGYQLLDWQIKRLWQDLIILLYEKINPFLTNGWDKLGIHWGSPNWVDGIAKDGTTWVACDKPSKYVDSPTSSTDGYFAINYTAPSSSGEIQKLGYDSNHPFANMPDAIVSNPSYNTYYCNSYNYNSGNRPIYCIGYSLSSAWAGVFNYATGYLWSDNRLSPYSRLCYRPIS